MSFIIHVFRILRIKHCLEEVLEQSEGGTPALYAMAICDRWHIHASEQRTFFDYVNISPPFLSS